MTDRIITLETPESGQIGVLKNGKQIGLVYWADLDSKKYRRVATWMDLAMRPWEGEGQIVRHPPEEKVSKIRFGSLHLWDAEVAGVMTPEDRNYTISQYPVVEYPHPVKNWIDPSSPITANTRTTPLSVEGTFDEAYLSADASPELRAKYPDLRVREAEESVGL